jgi:hypothetical protein
MKNYKNQFMKTLPGYTEVKTLDFVVKISNSTVKVSNDFIQANWS